MKLRTLSLASVVVLVFGTISSFGDEPIKTPDGRLVHCAGKASTDEALRAAEQTLRLTYAMTERLATLKQTQALTELWREVETTVINFKRKYPNVESPSLEAQLIYARSRLQ